MRVFDCNDSQKRLVPSNLWLGYSGMLDCTCVMCAVNGVSGVAYVQCCDILFCLYHKGKLVATSK